ncbi:MAG: hypothetical protein IANPNBLG_00259 [Bryobacteraceae bacterium]|nr:hypothetical protein [Bryobacteraceae bacterium]
MERNELDYGKPNANAPRELDPFAFLLEGHYILDGYAIADEYRMRTPEDQLLVLGINLRSYDAVRKTWNMKWLNALPGTWTDLGPEELGGVAADETTISYCMKEPVARHALTRATYVRISADRFTWRGERSHDGKAWEQFLVIELHEA